MNTKTFEQFDTMTVDALANVEGGNQVAFEGGGADWYAYVTYCKDGIHVTPWPYICPEKRGKK
ncbi:bacteriocin class II family protein [Streptococcus equinus]|uniref:bacteriocin class II family protein n=1 Tax=Streptococcus equinus TaxID=1335 RepID=UPI001FB4779C|nr:bacteriocin class II family protein [Streptococcus equinus]